MRLALALSLVALTSAAHADGIDLSKPWGNKDGCRNRVQQEVYSENMLLLKKDAIVTSGSACAVTKTTTNPDGSLTLDTTCDYEGGDSEAVRFQVKRTGKALSIVGPDGEFGKVLPCR